MGFLLRVETIGIPLVSREPVDHHWLTTCALKGHLCCQMRVPNQPIFTHLPPRETQVLACVHNLTLDCEQREVMAKGKFISYLRVSTDKQGRSGLGLEAQRTAVESYLNGAGGRSLPNTSKPKAANAATVRSSQRLWRTRRPSARPWSSPSWTG
jgi:hypothetical protein